MLGSSIEEECLVGGRVYLSVKIMFQGFILVLGSCFRGLSIIFRGEDRLNGEGGVYLSVKVIFQYPVPDISSLLYFLIKEITIHYIYFIISNDKKQGEQKNDARQLRRKFDLRCN